MLVLKIPTHQKNEHDIVMKESYCPICKQKLSGVSQEFAPFCSERCRMIDLGHWFSDSYIIPDREEREGQKEEGLES